MLRILLIPILLVFQSFFIPAKAGVLRQVVLQRAQSKNTKALIQFADSISRQKILCIDHSIHWDCHWDNSQFIGDYWQFGFRFAETGIGRKDEYTDVYFFVALDKPIYMEVIDILMPKDSGLFFQFTDSLNMKKFSTTWENTYGVKLKLGDFDSLDYAYGFKCGDGGVRMEGRVIIDEMVRQRDTVQLNQWLASPLPGRQAYAVDGLFQLNQRGIMLSAQQKKMIKAVQNRDAALNTCAGGIWTVRRLKDSARIFAFN